MEPNDQIKALLGTSPAKMSDTGQQKISNPSLKAIATNGALLNQNINQLTVALRKIISDLNT